MIILHFDLQPQFKYMNYFMYTSHNKWLSLFITDDFEKAVNKQSPARAVGKELQVSIICVSPSGITDYLRNQGRKYRAIEKVWTTSRNRSLDKYWL